jgi:alpha-ketoglutarate-dependent taurine dioxygenase
MEQGQSSSPAKPRFGGARRKVVDLAAAPLVKVGELTPGQPLPLLVEPASPGVDLADWAAANRDEIEANLLRHGAVLFRGFGLHSADAFEGAATAICPELFGEYGDLPREGVGGKVYGSTPYPPDMTILFHNEGSHLPRWPLRQFFYCAIAAQSGGETPILDCREVHKQLDPALREKFATKGLMYVRNFSPGVDVPWQKFFHSEDRAAVEEACRKDGMTCEWTKDDGLRIRQLAQAVARHPKTGEMVFFNQVQLHHPSCLDPAVWASLRSLFAEEDMPRNVYYGDGTPIEEETMETLGKLYWKLAVAFPWQEGDMILLDNMLVAHARNPYVGPRKIGVAMGAMMTAADLEAAPAGGPARG